MPLNGLVTMTPTTVDKAGTSSTATINANGSVTFSACTSLSLNGVFTSSYKNYMIVMRHVRGTSDDYVYFRLRASGADAVGTTDYVSQYTEVITTTVATGRSTTSRWYGFKSSATTRNGGALYLFSPYETVRTGFRTASVAGTTSGALFDAGGTHAGATSFDGITFENAGGTPTYTGLVTVYGFNE